jgi:formylglycine-generating enzyme required for sulfatase activity
VLRIAIVTIALITFGGIDAVDADPRSTRSSTVRVGPGTYRPLFPASPSETSVRVPAFELDRDPVTNAEFLAFVDANPTWRKGRIARLLADAEYLAHWSNDLVLGEAPPRAPVVRVSWFAARAFCAWRNARLPTEREWELAAAASERRRDGSRDRTWRDRILAWYARPTPDVMPDVGRGRPNAWGVRDMHGLIWEWVDDFNSALVGTDDRDPDAVRDRFCGAASARSTDAAAYATFMRIAFRSSLEARYTTANLGFRCAR